MKKFELPAGTHLKLTKTTPRKEFAGDERVQAISLRFSMACEAARLNELHPNLQDMLLWRPPELDAQQDIAGVPSVKPNVRVPIIKQPLKVDLEFTGYTVAIEHGIGDPIELYMCTLSKFEVEAIEGGSAIIAWSVASNKEITPEVVGALCDLEGGEVDVTQTAPTVTEGDPIDGSVGHPGARRDDEDQGELLDDGDDGPGDSDQDGAEDEPTDGDGGGDVSGQSGEQTMATSPEPDEKPAAKAKGRRKPQTPEEALAATQE